MRNIRGRVRTGGEVAEMNGGSVLSSPSGSTVIAIARCDAAQAEDGAHCYGVSCWCDEAAEPIAGGTS
jgi:hypothetical protein